MFSALTGICYLLLLECGLVLECVLLPGMCSLSRAEDWSREVEGMTDATGRTTQDLLGVMQKRGQVASLGSQSPSSKRTHSNKRKNSSARTHSGTRTHSSKGAHPSKGTHFSKRTHSSTRAGCKSGQSKP